MSTPDLAWPLMILSVAAQALKAWIDHRTRWRL